MTNKKTVLAVCLSLSMFFAINAKAQASEDSEKASDLACLEYDDTDLDKYYGLEENHIDYYYDENANQVEEKTGNPIESDQQEAPVEEDVKGPVIDKDLPQKDIDKPKENVDKSQDDKLQIDEFKGLNKLNQNNDYESPTYKTGLNVDQLTRIINYAFPGNKLIKDNNPILIRDFVKTLKAIEDQLGISPYFILGIINAENPIMNGQFSQIVRDKNNLMSRNCYDDDPYGKSSCFASYADSIILPAKFLRINYLDPKGMYYEGGSVRDVNKHYATAQNRYKNVLYGMERLNEARHALFA